MFNVWALLALASAAAYAIGMMVNRVLTRTEDSLPIPLYLSVFGCLALLPFMPFIWKSTPYWKLLILFVVGLLAGIAQFCTIQAYRYAAAYTTITFDYMGVFYIAIVSYLVFAEAPSWNLMSGAALLIGSGLFIFTTRHGNSSAWPVRPTREDHRSTASRHGVHQWRVDCLCMQRRFGPISYRRIFARTDRLHTVLVMGLIVAATIAGLRRKALFVGTRWSLLVARGVLSAIATVSFFYSIEFLELDDAVTLALSVPIFVALLSGRFLGERVSTIRWVAILIGFGGVAYVMHPGGGLFNAWVVLALFSALAYAVAIMTNRALTKTEDSLTILFYMSLFGGPILMPFIWKSTPYDELPTLFGVGFFAAFAQYCMVQAYRYGAANTVIVFDYTGVRQLLGVHRGTQLGVDNRRCRVDRQRPVRHLRRNATAQADGW